MNVSARFQRTLSLCRGQFQIASSLRFLRGDRDRLSSRARKLAAINPRMANANLCGDVTERWQQLESQLHAPHADAATPAALGGAELNVDLPFHEKVSLTEHAASRYLMFGYGSFRRTADPTLSLKASLLN